MTMLVTLNTGLLLWVVYGLWIRSMPLVLTNVLTFVLAFPLLIMKVRFHNAGESETRTKSAAGSK